jgi:hypothetical protein
VRGRRSYRPWIAYTPWLVTPTDKRRVQADRI